MKTITTIEGVPHSDYAKHGLGRETLLGMLRKMIEIRRFEEKVEELFLVKGLLIGPSHLYLGQEAIAVGAVAALKSDDPIITTYRGHGHALAKGVSAKLAMAELFGKATGTCKGLGGSMHVAIYPEKGSLYATAIVASGIPIAAGVGLAFKYTRTDRIVLVFFGDGAVNTGAFHEGLNLAALWKLPVIFVCENNMYAMSTRVDRAVAGGSIAARGSAYGIDSMVANGNDVVAVYAAVKQAAERARRGVGPTLIECQTYKHKGHGVYDKGEYRPREEIEEWLGRDPILHFKEALTKAQVITESEIARMENEINLEIEESVKFGLESPLLPFDELSKLVYA